MNYDQITGVLRAFIPAICAYFVAKGWISSDTVGLIVTAAVTVAAAIWSIVNNKTGKVIK